jgi:FkbM family methyltransferase
MALAVRQELILRHVLPLLHGGVAVDVGANNGVYSYAFSRRRMRIVAFEPLQKLAERLAKLNPTVQVHACALSKVSGQLPLYVPSLDGRPALSRASLNPDANPGFENKITVVPVRRLDDFALEDVRVIKIDVEGHERDTLEGAQNTIARYKPLLIVEIEERHHPNRSRDLIRWIRGLGYRGFYASTGCLQDIERFDFATMQQIGNIKSPFGSSAGEYINNFLFKPE